MKVVGSLLFAVIVFYVVSTSLALTAIALRKELLEFFTAPLGQFLWWSGRSPGYFLSVLLPGLGVITLGLRMLVYKETRVAVIRS